MKADVIHDYRGMPDVEIQISKEAVEGSDTFRLVDVVRKEKNVGGETVYLGIVLYEEVNEVG